MSVEPTLNSAKKAQQLGQYAEAEQLYLKLLNDGFHPEAMLSALVNVSILANAVSRACGYLSQLMAKFPSKLKYCDALASLHSRAGDWNAAADCYAAFIVSNPDHADAYYNHAFNLKLAAKYSEAINSYQLALDKDVRKPEEVLTNMAVIYSENLRLEAKAKQSLELALESDPNYIPAMFNLATLYEEEGNKNAALKYYQKILEREPANYSALVRSAEAQSTGDPNSPTIRRLEQALSNPVLDNATRTSLCFALGKVLDDCGRYHEAFKYYTDGNRLNGENGKKYNREVHEKFVSDNIIFFSDQWFATLTPLSEAKTVFICGMFRSGSTLIEQILASHSGVTAGGERDFFLRVVGERLHPYPSGIDSLTQSSLLEIANDYLTDLAKAFPEAHLVTDKRPENFIYLGLIKALFPNARIIQTKRQKLDNCLSVYFLRASASLKYANNLSDIAHYYEQYERLMSHWISLFSDDIFQVSYDRLVVEPEPEVRSLLNFLELPWESECLNFHSTENIVKTASVWQVRQPLHKNSSGRWRNYESYIQDLMQALKD